MTTNRRAYGSHGAIAVYYGVTRAARRVGKHKLEFKTRAIFAVVRTTARSDDTEISNTFPVSAAVRIGV